MAQPVGVTDMPFREEHIKIEVLITSSHLNNARSLKQDTEKKAQFFFDMNAKMDEGDG